MSVYVVGRHHWRGLSISVCQKGVVETVGERPKEKNECALWIECEGGGGRGGRVHAREKVSGSYKG